MVCVIEAGAAVVSALELRHNAWLAAAGQSAVPGGDEQSRLFYCSGDLPKRGPHSAVDRPQIGFLGEVGRIRSAQESSERNEWSDD
jgi:hypothetical protein